MANFNEMSGIKQWGAVVGVGLVLTVALYFTMFKSQREANATAQAALETSSAKTRNWNPIAQAGGYRAPAGQPQAAAGD